MFQALQLRDFRLLWAGGFLLAALGAGFLLGAPVIRRLLDRGQPRTLLTVSLTAAAVAYFLLFTSSSLTVALPAAVAIGAFGSMSLLIPQTTVPRVIPNAVLGRVSAVFLTGEAAATLTGAVAGPFLAQATHFTGVATAASLLTLSAALLASGYVGVMPKKGHMSCGNAVVSRETATRSPGCGTRLLINGESS